MPVDHHAEEADDHVVADEIVELSLVPIAANPTLLGGQDVLEPPRVEWQSKLAAIPAKAPGATPSRPQPAVLEELVATVRGFETRFARLEESLTDSEFRPRRRRRLLHPMIFEEISSVMSEEGDEPVALLMLAGAVRDELPWLYELVVEVARDIKAGNSGAARRAVDRLQRATKLLRRGPFMEELGGKDVHHLAMELPRILDHALARMQLPRSEPDSN